MAWTSLTYSFLSVLTSTKMTATQDNFTALAQGLSGAPKIKKEAIEAAAGIEDTKLGTISTAGKVQDTALSANVDLLNAAQTITETKTFTTQPYLSFATPHIIYTPTADSQPQGLRFNNSAGGQVATLLYTESQKLLSLFNVSTEKFSFDISTGIMTLGTVPLARMGSIVLNDASDQTLTETNIIDTPLLSSSNHAFFIYSVKIVTAGYNSKLTGASIINSAAQDITSLFSHILHFNAATWYIETVNPTGGGVSLTFRRKVYQLVES